MTLKVNKPRTLRQRLADYKMRRFRSATAAPGDKQPYPAQNLSEYSKLSPLSLPAGKIAPNLQGPLALKGLGATKPKLPKL